MILSDTYLVKQWHTFHRGHITASVMTHVTPIIIEAMIQVPIWIVMNGTAAYFWIFSFFVLLRYGIIKKKMVLRNAMVVFTSCLYKSVR